MIELYLYIKIYLYYFPGRLKNMPNLENHRGSHFEFQFQKLLRLYHNTYILLFCMDLSTEAYRGLWFNRTHLPLFQNMSLKIYIKFFLSSGGYNFKIKYLKDKMKHRMWVHILLSNLASSLTWVLLLAQEATMLWKISKILPWDIWVQSFLARK